jgi:hypothetical protein
MDLNGAVPAERNVTSNLAWRSEATMLRNEYVVVEVNDRDVRLQQRPLRFEFLVSKSEFASAISADIAIGDTFSGIDRGSVGPFDLVLESKAPYEPHLEAKPMEVAEQANFIFVAHPCAATAQEAECRLEKASGGEFAVISGETRRAANGWLVPIKLRAGAKRPPAVPRREEDSVLRQDADIRSLKWNTPSDL